MNNITGNSIFGTAFFSPNKTSLTGEASLTYQQKSTDFRQSEIAITTDEGDRITLSGSQINALGHSGDIKADSSSTVFNTVLAQVQESGFSLEIQGDLNSEELHDLESLIKDLTLIAEDFFNGNMSGAVENALNIGDLGSLSTLSATFLHTMTMSSELTSSSQKHQKPFDAPALDETFALQPDRTSTESSPEQVLSYTDLLIAQWAQIEEIMDRVAASSKEQRKEQELHPPIVENGVEPVSAMMQRISDIVSIHPRITPLIPPTTSHLINRVASEQPDSESTVGKKNQLSNNFFNAFNSWMLS